jgi:hypothetical protein
MEVFDYLAIAFTLVLSLSAVRLIGGLPDAVKPGVRYGVHLAFVAWQLIVTSVAFWILLSYREATWTLPMFGLVLTSLGLIYYNACVLIPENSNSVVSWRDHFNTFRRRYFIGVAAWMITAAASSTIVIDMPLLHPARIGHALIIAAAIAGFTARSERTHALLAAGLLLFSLIMALSFGYQPGGFAQP